MVSFKIRKANIITNGHITKSYL